jgi:hypothetical protein
VVSDPIVAARYTPKFQLADWYTSGTTDARRPPNRNALIGTPSGSSHASSIEGHCDAGAVKRALGCAALRPQSGVHAWPCQSVSSAGGRSVMPSHQTSPSGVSATLVKMQLARMVAIAFGFDAADVPGATPKKPASGLMA